jgi:hypothetical protein
VEQIEATQVGEQGADRLLMRRRRPPRSPVAPSQLAARVWRVVNPFVPLVVLVVVFALSLGVVHVVEHTTPIPTGSRTLGSVASQGPGAPTVGVTQGESIE